MPARPSGSTATTEIYTLLYTLSLHDALPIFRASRLQDKQTLGLSAFDIAFGGTC